MTTPAVSFEHVTKRYPRGGTKDGARYASLRHDLSSIGKRARARLHGRGVHEKGTLALDDVSFDVAGGGELRADRPQRCGQEHGAELSDAHHRPHRRNDPSSRPGRGLIEVGSGVHPELTGRENIWLYGSILGLTRVRHPQPVRRDRRVLRARRRDRHAGQVLLDRHAAAAGVLDRGHLKPDIFVVDEALAVGDVNFQAKCVERMSKLVAEGRTLLFVSHNLFIVEAVCTRGLLLLDGKVEELGEIRTVLSRYISIVDEGLQARRRTDQRIEGVGLELLSATLHDAAGAERYTFSSGEGFEVRLRLKAHHELSNCQVSVGLTDGRHSPLAFCSMLEDARGVELRTGEQTVTCRLSGLPLRPRNYEVSMSVRDASGLVELIEWSQVTMFRVGELADGYGLGSTTLPWLAGPFRVDHRWMVES